MLRRDPSRTTMLRKRFLRELAKRFAVLKREITQLIYTEDALALEDTTPLNERLTENAARQRWQFLRSDQKIGAYRDWLQGQMDSRILSLDSTGSAWTGAYVKSAYKQGLLNAFMAARRGKLGDPSSDFYTGSMTEFLRSAFGGGVAIEKLDLLATRTYEGLKGVTTQMSTQMSRVLASGIADGKNPYQLARQLNEEVGFALSRAARIARTEIMHAHAEGQLDSFDRLGVEELGILAEWSTAGDDRVCPLCAPMEGAIFTIKEARGMIPRHPNCRCTYIPANVNEKEKGQVRSKSGITAAIRESARQESPKAKTTAEAVNRSRWVGVDKRISGKASQTTPRGS